MAKFAFLSRGNGRFKWMVILFAVVVYTVMVANVTRFYTLREMRSSTSVSDKMARAVVTSVETQKEHHKEDIDVEAWNALTSDWSANSIKTPVGGLRSCPSRSALVLAPQTGSDVPCSGHGKCNAASICICEERYAGSACDIDIAFTLGSSLWTTYKQERNREATDAQSGSLSGETSNRLVTAEHVSKLLTIVLPVAVTSSHPVESVEWKKQIKESINALYPLVRVVEVAPRSSETPTGFPGNLDVVGAWNDGLSTVVTPWTLLLSPSVIALHEHTNLELMMTLLLSSDVDVLGFSTLRPATNEEDGGLLIPKSKSDSSDESHRSPSGRKEFVYHTDCWNFHGPDRWTLSHEKPLFGYAQHIGKYAVVCGRTSDSIILRTPPAPQSPSKVAPLFNSSMGVSALTDFFLRLQRDRRVVATCVECLLKVRMSGSPVMSSGAQTRANRITEEQQFRRWDASTVLPPVWSTSSKVSTLFSETYQTEVILGPHQVELQTIQRFRNLDVKQLERPFKDLMNENAIACTKSGGIYGHSKFGLYSPLCHRFQRQRDFAYLALLWTDGSTFQSSDAVQNTKRRRYGVSLHHGNMFGALRMGVELLWETDGDIDFVAFDDTHDEMMARWDRFMQHVVSHAGFETKINYPEKPWYVQLLRDKTDFQVNVRGVKSEYTRGRPPHIHNVSVYYQGFRCYVNGFQNPWVGIRADPGHDYRRNYLAQQGWVLNFAKSSISCKVPGHPACLPPCSDPQWVMDRNFCDEWRDNANRSDFRPLDVLPSHLRDPVLFV